MPILCHHPDCACWDTCCDDLAALRQHHIDWHGGWKPLCSHRLALLESAETATEENLASLAEEIISVTLRTEDSTITIEIGEHEVIGEAVRRAFDIAERRQTPPLLIGGPHNAYHPPQTDWFFFTHRVVIVSLGQPVDAADCFSAVPSHFLHHFHWCSSLY